MLFIDFCVSKELSVSNFLSIPAEISLDGGGISANYEGNMDASQDHLFGASNVGRDSHGTRTSTTHSAISKHLDVEELEMLLEAYFVQIDGTLNKLSTVRLRNNVFFHLSDQFYFEDVLLLLT